MEKVEIFRNALANGRVNLAKGMEHTHISVAEVANLVNNSSIPERHPGVKLDSKSLLIKMAENVWDIVAGPHGPNDDSRDKTLHITIRFQDRSAYHLRLDAKNHLFQIKQAKNGNIIESKVYPWQAPGTLHNK
ncbi:MAG TPA: hypothetical protein PLP23_10575 [Panacibacter sp.]|nr:hypothetical protein [Panacibacter sp.]